MWKRYLSQVVFQQTESFREKFSEFKNIQTNEGNQIEVHFPKMEYCTDNAAMIGVAAYYDLMNNSQIELGKQYDVDAISTKN